MPLNLQKLALKLRAEGGVYKPQKHKRKVVKQHAIDDGTLLKGQNMRNQDKRRKADEKQLDKEARHGTPTWRPIEKTEVCALHFLFLPEALTAPAAESTPAQATRMRKEHR